MRTSKLPVESGAITIQTRPFIMKTMKTILTVSLLAGAMAMTARAESPVKKPAPNPAVQGNTAFALDIYGQLRTQPGNLFFSPYSISTALAMTQAGARGDTAAEMAKVLHLPAPAKEAHAAFAQLQGQVNAVQGKGKVRLTVGNALFPHENYKFKPEYIRLVTDQYAAGVEPLDYLQDTEGARTHINQWVEKRTNDKIKNLIKPGMLDPLTRMVLVNAIHFKGDWSSQFKPRFTREQPFHVTAGKRVKTPMMYQTTQARLAQTADLQMLELPYTGNDVSMCILLPRKVDGLAALEAKLDAKLLGQLTAQARQMKVRVTLPKFKMTSEFRLRNVLEKLGMKLAFSRNADFSGMDGTRNLYVYDVVHKAFVDVNEEGTEAAAATGVIINTRSAPILPNFRADRPFLFLIRDKTTGSILFLGRYAQPVK